MATTTWISIREAAEILGVGVSTVPKLTRRGLLSPRPAWGRRPSLDRDQVEALSVRRVEEARQRERDLLRRLVEADERHPYPPDSEHDWLTVPQAATLLGVSRQAVAERCRRGRIRMHKSLEAPAGC